MCGIVGVVAKTPVNQLLYDGLQVLQHRGQDAAGIATAEESRFHMHKGSGFVRDVFRTRNMRSLPGNWGIAHCRYPTAGSAFNSAEAQPFYVNSPFGIMLAHNGNLTNADDLKRDMFLQDLRHINTNSDSEVLLNVLAHELQAAATRYQLDEDTVFKAVAGVHRRCRGAYAVVAMIAGLGLVAFRDPYGIRPLIIGRNITDEGPEYLVASESVALDTLGFQVLRDVMPGEAVLVTTDGTFHSRECADRTVHAPCIFEFVYLARPDSLIDGISVYESRVKMGEYLAAKIHRTMPHLKVDAVIPIPDSSRPAAMELASRLNLPYREGFVKNRYIGRTFIMPGQEEVGQAETQYDRPGVSRQERAAGGRLHRARDDEPRDRADGQGGGFPQGLLCLCSSAGSLPECVRHRHADAQGVDRIRPLGRGHPQGDRRRCADLPGSGRPEGGSPRLQSVDRLLRNLLFRRPIHHGRRDARVPVQRRDSAQRLQGLAVRRW